MEPLQPGEEAMYGRWVRMRSRLEAVLGEQSRLPAALAAYAVDRPNCINLMAVRVLREEYGADSEPSAEELMLLLAEVRDPPPAQDEGGEASRWRPPAENSHFYGPGYLDEVREGWPE